MVRRSGEQIVDDPANRTAIAPQQGVLPRGMGVVFMSPGSHVAAE